MKIEQNVTVTIPGQLMIGGLRELVKVTDNMPSGAVVDIRQDSDQRDGTSTTIKVTVR